MSGERLLLVTCSCLQQRMQLLLFEQSSLLWWELEDAPN
jgi:hypothetical protein